MKKGFLLVIDGIDGSGKTTQIELLKQSLASQGQALQVINFPRYGENIYADTVKDYLEGKFGPIKQVDPHLIALAYAGDRLLAKPQIENWLSGGGIVIANRYVSASKAHLGANLSNSNSLEIFLDWIERLEYKTNGMPEEDLTILLDIDAQVSQTNTQGKYILDVHESNISHLEQARKIYSLLSKKEKNWAVVNCMENGKMLPEEDIHKQIMEIIKNKGR